SGNLWYPIIGHFMNNGVQVLAVYAGQMDPASEAPNLGTMPAETQTSLMIMVVGSLVVGSILLKTSRGYFMETQIKNSNANSNNFL
ncbi:MAG: hypothetical protein AB8B69_06745, partial [Chitinophagales bacterium]